MVTVPTAMRMAAPQVLRKQGPEPDRADFYWDSPTWRTTQQQLEFPTVATTLAGESTQEGQGRGQVTWRKQGSPRR
jgi:hypothetical protein